MTTGLEPGGLSSGRATEEREAVLSNMGEAGTCERSVHILKDGRKSDSLGARSSNASEMYYMAHKACGPASIAGRNPMS